MARSKRYTIQFLATLNGELIEACEIRLFAKSFKRATRAAWSILPDMRDYSGAPVDIKLKLHRVALAP